MLETSQTVGDFYTQMQWTVIHAKDGEFLTSDAPVSRHNPGHDGGLFGGGLINPTTEVLFPLSKNTYLFICHDQERMQKFSQLLEAGKMEEAKAVRRELPPIKECLVLRPYVNALNRQAILNADRFVYSPFESHEIPRLLKGESQNSRIVVSSPFGKRPTERE